MSKFLPDEDILWATATTGDDFQCVHVDTAREMASEIERLDGALRRIARYTDKNAKFEYICVAMQTIARNALSD